MLCSVYWNEIFDTRKNHKVGDIKGNPRDLLGELARRNVRTVTNILNSQDQCQSCEHKDVLFLFPRTRMFCQLFAVAVLNWFDFQL